MKNLFSKFVRKKNFLKNVVMKRLWKKHFKEKDFHQKNHKSKFFFNFLSTSKKIFLFWCFLFIFYYLVQLENRDGEEYYLPSTNCFCDILLRFLSGKCYQNFC